MRSSTTSRRARAVALVLGAVVLGTTVPGALAASAAVQAQTTTPWPGGRWQPEAATYGMGIEANVPVTMADGTVLFANIGYPTDLATGAKAPGPFPVLLSQAPYVSSQQPAEFYVTRGYLNAVVQVRGTGDTTGPKGEPIASDMFGPEQIADGVALVDWAAKLPGSDGKVGLYGCSQLGINQIFTAAAVGQDSPLKVILPACASNGYDTYFSGGVPNQIMGLFGSFSSSILSGPKNAELNDASAKALKAEVLAGGPKAYDREYWQARTTANAWPDVVANEIPALLWTGWTPTDGPLGVMSYAIAQNAWAKRPPYGAMSPKQKVTGRYQLVVGPWEHGRGLDDTIQLEWYDTWLKGADTGMVDTPTPMHLYEQQSNRWVNAAMLPMTDEYTALHLAEDGALSSKAPTAGSTTLRLGDPATPGTTAVFDAPALDETKVVAGPVGATLWAKSSNRNILLLATLNDVAADGTVQQIVGGNIVGSLRAINAKSSWTDRNGLMIRPDQPFQVDKYAAPNSLQRYDIALSPTLWSVAAGHHLQLVVSTQPPTDKCASVLSALTIGLPCLPTAPQQESLAGGSYELVWSKTAPSTINVPLVAPGDLAPAASGVTATSRGFTEPLAWGSGHS